MDGEVTAGAAFVFHGFEVSFLRRTFEPARLPGVFEHCDEVGLEIDDRCGSLTQGRKHLVGRTQVVHDGQLLVHILEEFLRRNGRRSDVLRVGDDGSDGLQQVVEQHAKRSLEDDRLRAAADQMRQVKNIGDLLENILDAPALTIEGQEVVGRIECDVEQVGDEDDGFLILACQRDAADGHAALTRAV